MDRDWQGIQQVAGWYPVRSPMVARLLVPKDLRGGCQARVVGLQALQKYTCGLVPGVELPAPYRDLLSRHESSGFCKLISVILVAYNHFKLIRIHQNAPNGSFCLKLFLGYPSAKCSNFFHHSQLPCLVILVIDYLLLSQLGVSHRVALSVQDNQCWRGARCNR